MTRTPGGVTAMTIEARSDYEARITVERGNGDSIQTMELTSLEWKMLLRMLETFGQGYSPSVSMEFKAKPVKRLTA